SDIINKIISEYEMVEKVKSKPIGNFDVIYKINDDTGDIGCGGYGRTNLNSNSNSDDFFCVFYLDKYIEDILKSYKYNTKNIVSQFVVDFDRETIIINNKRCTSVEEFCESTKYLQHIRSYNKLPHDI